VSARVTAFFLRRELRRRAAAYLGLALVLALGGGAAIGAVIAAYRTDRAYPSYVRNADVVDLVVNPSLATNGMDDAIRHLPSVRQVHTDSLLFATVSVTRAARVRELLEADPMLQIRGSTDGRYVDVDRPAITEGRFATGRSEVFVSDDYRADLDRVEGRRLHAGDFIDIAFWSPLHTNVEPPLSKVVAPLGVEHLRIAGFGHLPDEVLRDELYARQRLVVSADVAHRYTCLMDLRPDMSDAEALAAAFPSGCATQYQYYALELAPGSGSRSAVRVGFTEATRRLEPSLPQLVKKIGTGYYYVATDRHDVDHAVAQVTRPTVAALFVFGVVAALATLTIAGLVIARIMRVADAEQTVLRALGATRAERAAVAASPCLVSVLAGLCTALVVAVAASVVGPVGSVRALTPNATWAAPGLLTILCVLVMAIVMTAVVAVLAIAAARRPRSALGRRRPSRLWSSMRSAPPAAAQGLSTALNPRPSDGGVAVVAGCVVAVAALLAALVFGSNLTALVRSPTRYGWPWDVTIITGAGYGDTLPAQVAKTLDNDPAVEDYGLFAFDSSTTISGRTIPAVLGFPGAAARLPVVAGRNATVPGEAVLGATTAQLLAVHVGDRVTVGSPIGDLHVEVVGIAVLPSLGAFLSDRTGLGTGVYLPVALDPGKPDGEIQYPASLTAIHLRAGVDRRAFLARIGPSLPKWDLNGEPPTSIRSVPVRPPVIVDADTMRTAPIALGGMLAVGLIVGLTLSIGVSVRDRRRELAILRALGFSRRDLRATVVWQALAVVAVGLVVGLPLGVWAGRTAWRTFAHALGISTHADISVVGLAAVALGAVVLGVLAAMPPARRAARTSPSELLHDLP
jgi:hypothetical protein